MLTRRNVVFAILSIVAISCTTGRPRMTARVIPMPSKSCQTEEPGRPKTCALPCLVPIATATPPPSAFEWGACIRGQRPLKPAVGLEPRGDCRLTMNGGSWQRPMEGHRAIRTVAPHSRRCLWEALQDSTPFLEATANRGAAMPALTNTASIGPPPNPTRSMRCSTTLAVEAGYSIATKAVTNQWPRQYGALGQGRPQTVT